MKRLKNLKMLVLAAGIFLAFSICNVSAMGPYKGKEIIRVNDFEFVNVNEQINFYKNQYKINEEKLNILEKDYRKDLPEEDFVHKKYVEEKNILEEKLDRLRNKLFYLNKLFYYNMKSGTYEDSKKCKLDKIKEYEDRILKNLLQQAKLNVKIKEFKETLKKTSHQGYKILQDRLYNKIKTFIFMRKSLEEQNNDLKKTIISLKSKIEEAPIKELRKELELELSNRISDEISQDLIKELKEPKEIELENKINSGLKENEYNKTKITKKEYETILEELSKTMLDIKAHIFNLKRTNSYGQNDTKITYLKRKLEEIKAECEKYDN